MSLRKELEMQVAAILREQWTARDGVVVPEAEDVGLGNDAVKLPATVLYADFAESTALVDSYDKHFAAEIYKAYLHCAAKVIRSEGGDITAYDGDRIMAVFLGGSKNSCAVRAALKINWSRVNLINPALKAQYPTTGYAVKHTTGVDTSELWVARTGIRNANDLVWVGRSANHAAKLCGLDASFPTWISGEVYDSMEKGLKVSAGNSMWTEMQWTEMSGRRIYRSNYMWAIS
jgi:class 3 adenylate cyclase